jgi:uncharacterized protein (TIGR02145 family)
MKTLLIVCIALMSIPFSHKTKSRMPVNPLEKNARNPNPGTETYASVKIGKQEWMSINLNENTFRNGETIPEAKTEAEWTTAQKNKKPAWCYYKNDPANGKTYGRLYNWYAVSDFRSLAPAGWHIPNEEEWTTLVNHVGDFKNASKKLKSKTLWTGKWKGNNHSGFEGLPSGSRDWLATFSGIGEQAYFWTMTPYGDNNSLFFVFSSNTPNMSKGNQDRGYGFAVRCIKN